LEKNVTAYQENTGVNQEDFQDSCVKD